uniref:Glycosyltransferase 61 catalytic domain-containing protein n=1 Tax=Palpitomonas bilix TaxID=652834 RepID=A0A7S3GJ27_9EUKA
MALSEREENLPLPYVFPATVHHSSLPLSSSCTSTSSPSSAGEKGGATRGESAVRREEGVVKERVEVPFSSQHVHHYSRSSQSIFRQNILHHLAFLSDLLALSTTIEEEGKVERVVKGDYGHKHADEESQNKAILKAGQKMVGKDADQCLSSPHSYQQDAMEGGQSRGGGVVGTSPQVVSAVEWSTSSTSLHCFDELRLGVGVHEIASGGHGFSNVGIRKSDLAAFRCKYVGAHVRQVVGDRKDEPIIIVVEERQSTRRVLNNAELINMVKDVSTTTAGQRAVEVKSVNFGGMSIEEQAKIVNSATVFMAVHGAAFANLVFLPEHAGVVELFPCYFTLNQYEVLAAQLGLNYYKWDCDDERRGEWRVEKLDECMQNDTPLSQCRDFWINSDVLVNVDAVKHVFSSALADALA